MERQIVYKPTPKKITELTDDEITMYLSRGWCLLPMKGLLVPPKCHYQTEETGSRLLPILVGEQVPNYVAAAAEQEQRERWWF